ncbi:MAG: hypothetical protein ABIT20_16220 [Gemmatimonadaceae bacterium]
MSGGAARGSAGPAWRLPKYVGWGGNRPPATYRFRDAAGSSQTGTSDFDLVQRPVSNALWIDNLWLRDDTIVGGYRGFGGNVYFVRKR